MHETNLKEMEEVESLKFSYLVVAFFENKNRIRHL